MPPEIPITTSAEILESLDERTFRANLPNGKTVHAHIPKRTTFPSKLQPGDRVTLELNPYDFSRARIRPLEQTNLTSTESAQ
jgi:translation initiation factor IF-1